MEPNDLIRNDKTDRVHSLDDMEWNIQNNQRNNQQITPPLPNELVRTVPSYNTFRVGSDQVGIYERPIRTVGTRQHIGLLKKIPQRRRIPSWPPDLIVPNPNPNSILPKKTMEYIKQGIVSMKHHQDIKQQQDIKQKQFMKKQIAKFAAMKNTRIKKIKVLESKINKPLIKDLLKLYERNRYLENENRRLNNNTFEDYLKNLDKGLDGFLECQLCTYRYPKNQCPMILTCGHMCCKKCLISWSRSPLNRDISCPFCKKKNQVPKQLHGKDQITQEVRESRCIKIATNIVDKTQGILSRLKRKKESSKLVKNSTIQKKRRRKKRKGALDDEDKKMICIDKFYDDIEGNIDYVMCRYCVPSKRKRLRKNILNHYFTLHRDDFFNIVVTDIKK